MPEGSAATKACPKCGETILAVAVKCKHCQSDLTVAPVRKSETLGSGILAIPAGAVLLIGIWGKDAVDSMAFPEFSEPTGVSPLAVVHAFPVVTAAVLNALGVQQLLHAIGFLTILSTAILCAIEAKQLGMGAATDRTPKGKKREGPAIWFVSVLLLWAVCYPMYLKRRALYGVRSRVALGLLAMLSLVGCWVIMDYAIAERVGQLQDFLRAIPKP